jgi:hypothetical protein
MHGDSELGIKTHVDMQDEEALKRRIEALERENMALSEAAGHPGKRNVIVVTEFFRCLVPHASGFGEGDDLVATYASGPVPAFNAPTISTPVQHVIHHLAPQNAAAGLQSATLPATDQPRC